MSDRTFAVGVVCFAIVVVVLGVIGAISLYRYNARCTDNGGHFERRNCRDVEDWICSTNMEGNTDCHFDTGTVCDTVCVGATPEAHEP